MVFYTKFWDFKKFSRFGLARTYARLSKMKNHQKSTMLQPHANAPAESTKLKSIAILPKGKHCGAKIPHTSSGDKSSSDI